MTGKLLTLDRALEPTLPALLALLDVPVEDAAVAGARPAAAPPAHARRGASACCSARARSAAAVVFEDLHWIDAETQALLDGLVESLPTARLLLLVNYRPEYQHGWGSKTYYTPAAARPAAGRERRGAARRAARRRSPTLAPLKQLLIERTEGNPFFLEESVRTLVETRRWRASAGRYAWRKPRRARIQVPATVQAVLAARIDRLPPEEKRLLQTAAVIGKDVPFALLQAIAELPEDALRRRLAHLQAAEFLYETSLFPDLEYTFKHALTHEVAYGEPAPGAAARAARPDRRRHRGAVPATAWRSTSSGSPTMPCGASCGTRRCVYLRQAGAKAPRALGATGRRCRPSSRRWWRSGICPRRPRPSRQAIDIRLDLRGVLAPLGELGR